MSQCKIHVKLCPVVHAEQKVVFLCVSGVQQEKKTVGDLGPYRAVQVMGVQESTNTGIGPPDQQAQHKMGKEGRLGAAADVNQGGINALPKQGVTGLQQQPGEQQVALQAPPGVRNMQQAPPGVKNIQQAPPGVKDVQQVQTGVQNVKQTLSGGQKLQRAYEGVGEDGRQSAPKRNINDRMPSDANLGREPNQVGHIYSHPEVQLEGGEGKGIAIDQINNQMKQKFLSGKGIDDPAAEVAIRQDPNSDVKDQRYEDGQDRDQEKDREVLEDRRGDVQDGDVHEEGVDQNVQDAMHRSREGARYPDMELNQPDDVV